MFSNLNIPVIVSHTFISKAMKAFGKNVQEEWSTTGIIASSLPPDMDDLRTNGRMQSPINGKGKAMHG